MSSYWNSCPWCRSWLIVMASHSMFRKTEKKLLRKLWIRQSAVRRLTWLHCPGHAGVRKIQVTDKAAGQGKIYCRLRMDKGHIAKAVLKRLLKNEEWNWKSNVIVKRLL